MGTPIDAVDVGDPFQLMVYTNDLRDDPMGVFAGYLDVVYSGTGAAEVSAPIEYGPKYPEGQEGTPMPGLIDELGAFDGISPFGDIGRVLLANVTFMATAAGALDFMSDAADDLPAHFTLIFGEDDPVDFSNITFGSDSLTINAASGFASPFTNPADQYDADQDGFLTPRDALVVINDLAANGARSLVSPHLPNAITAAPPTSMVDVNSDFFVSALDALWVVNEMAVRLASTPSNGLLAGGPLGGGLLTDTTSVVTTLTSPQGVAAGTVVNPPGETSEHVVAVPTPPVVAGGTNAYGHLVDAAFGDGDDDESDWESTLQSLALGMELE